MKSKNPFLMDELLYMVETYAERILSLLFMVFINYTCSDPLKVLYLKAELTLCALGRVSAQPIKKKIIHFQHHFALIEHVCDILFFSTSFGTPAYLYDS